MSDRYTHVVSVYGPRLENDFGFTIIQGCGFWGNFARETGEFQHYQEIGSGPTTGGRSWAQWTGPRRIAFLNHCKAHGLDPKSDEAGYSFLSFELRGAYKNVVAAVKRCKTIESATTTVERLYEGAGVKAMSQRIALAHKAHAIRSAGAASAATPTPPPPSVAPAKPKPLSDKHAVEPKKPAAVKKRAVPVHHPVKHVVKHKATR